MPNLECRRLESFGFSDWIRVLKGVTAVVHLVSPNEKACTEDPALAKLVVSDGTRCLVNAAEELGVSKIIYLSTFQVYGSNLRGMIRESTPPNPGNVYASVHLQAEAFVREFAGSGIVVRLANAVGPPANARANCWHLIANDLCREVVEAGTLTLRSSGLQHRSFVPMGSLVNIVSDLLTSSSASSKGVINVASPSSMSLRALANLIQEAERSISGHNAPITTGPAESSEEPFFVDVSAMENYLTDVFTLRGEIDKTLKLLHSQVTSQS
jgi:UDP-glucose 4-epimerase